MQPNTHLLDTFTAGRPTSLYKSVSELLEAFRDVIASHRFLLEDGKMLHRNMSEKLSNPAAEMETDLTWTGEKKLNSALSGGTSHGTGTMQFMAIEVLQAYKKRTKKARGGILSFRFPLLFQKAIGVFSFFNRTPPFPPFPQNLTDCGAGKDDQKEREGGVENLYEKGS